MPEGADPGRAEAELQKLRLVGNCLNAVEACDAQENESGRWRSRQPSRPRS